MLLYCDTGYGDHEMKLETFKDRERGTHIVVKTYAQSYFMENWNKICLNKDKKVCKSKMYTHIVAALIGAQWAGYDSYYRRKTHRIRNFYLEFTFDIEVRDRNPTCGGFLAIWNSVKYMYEYTDCNTWY